MSRASLSRKTSAPKLTEVSFTDFKKALGVGINVVRIPALIRPGHASDDDLIQASWRRFSRNNCFAFEFNLDTLLDKDTQTETTWAELVMKQCVLSFQKTWEVYLLQYTHHFKQHHHGEAHRKTFLVDVPWASLKTEVFTLDDTQDMSNKSVWRMVYHNRSICTSPPTADMQDMRLVPEVPWLIMITKIKKRKLRVAEQVFRTLNDEGVEINPVVNDIAPQMIQGAPEAAAGDAVGLALGDGMPFKMKSAVADFLARDAHCNDSA